MKGLRNVLAVLCFMASIFFLTFTIFLFVKPDVNGGTIGVVFTLIFFALGYFLRVKPHNHLDSNDDKNEFLVTSALDHVEGLPLGEGTLCNLSVTQDKLVIDGGGTDFNINNSQIRAVEVKTDTEIANIVHSSAAKGIAGGLLFGPIGLIVGSRATNKEKRTNTHYLIINYTNSNGEMAALMFDGGHTAASAQKITHKLRPIITNNPKQSVQL
ncbi:MULTISPECIES: hypothetical protein [unclassified Paenibacillus]|uniref:hypothetical protein n=1 Tax=unclassified Paenibacillus TaxID=185978 RepID=UPI0030FC9B17